MAKRLAIEWDNKELRIVAGTVRGGRVSISDVIIQPIEDASPEKIGEVLGQLTEQRGLQRNAAAIALGRGKAELRELKLPPVPEAELPDMVRFQAIRNFSTAGERSAIDFLPSKQDADGIRVVAAAVGPEELKNCALVALPSHLTVERLALRPVAAVALYRRVAGFNVGEVVLIDLLSEDADVVVVREGHTAFVRSIRLPEDPAIRVRTLASEVRRSLMASQDIGGVELPRRFVLWGRADLHADDLEKLSTALGSKVEALDPFTLVDVESKAKKELPEHVGRLAPLIGLLDAETTNGKDLIDFLNPRRPPKPPSKKPKMLLIGALAASIIGGGFFVGWNKLRQMDSAIASRKSYEASLKEGVALADESIGRTNLVETFVDGDVFWLDEFRRIAEQLPTSKEVMVSSVSASIPRDGGGEIKLAGGASNAGAVAEIGALLRDDQHTVLSKGYTLNADKAPYQYSFDETITFDRAYIHNSHEAKPTELADTTKQEPENTAPEKASEDDSDDGTPAENESDSILVTEENNSPRDTQVTEEDSPNPTPSSNETDESDIPAVKPDAEAKTDSPGAPEGATEAEPDGAETTESPESTPAITTPEQPEQKDPNGTEAPSSNDGSDSKETSESSPTNEAPTTAEVGGAQ